MRYSTAILLSSVGAAIASPLQKRQDASTVPTPTPTSSVDSAASTSMESTVATESTSAALSSASDAVSSVIASAMMNTTTAAAPTSTAAANATANSTYSGCPDGYSLTYVVGVDSYPSVNITDAYNAIVNWNTALPPPIALVNETGSGAGMAMRTWSAENLTVTEMLTNQTDNMTSGFVNQRWMLVDPITVTSSLILSNATSDLTLYTNTTTNAPTVQLYVNFCASSQDTGLALYSELVTVYLSGLNSLFTNSTSTTSNTTAVAGATSAVASATSSASGVVASATGAVSSAIGSATSGAVGGVTSAVASLTSAVAGGITSDIAGGANSIIGSITSAI